ncbi:hypothetical protein Unana1_06752 [Umbelopsis nana]
MGGIDVTKLVQGLCVTSGFLALVAVLFCLQIIRYRYFNPRRHDPPGGEVIRIGGLKDITLSKDSLELLPVHTYINIVEEKADTKEYDTCAICIEHFVARESEVRKLPCGHIFHIECVDPWLTERNGYCPNCKADCHIKPRKAPEEVDNAAENTVENARASDRVTLRHNIQQHFNRIRAELMPFAEPSNVTP